MSIVHKKTAVAAALSGFLAASIALAAAINPPTKPQTSPAMNAKEKANLDMVLDWWRIVIENGHVDETVKYQAVDYIQHNPNAETGMAGFKAYFNAIKPKQLPPIPAMLDNLVAIQAEGDYVTLSFVREEDDPAAKGKKYTTTWFDMLRVVNGKLVEHWDSATKGATGPVAASATKK